MSGGLVLNRRVGESIKIADLVTIEVVRIRGRQVQLRIICPRGVPVYRTEIYNQIQTEKDLKSDV